MAIKFLSGLNLDNVTGGSILKLDSNGNIVAATAGTDYATSNLWSTASSNNIYYSAGDVRIGTYQTSVDAAAKLHVFDYQTTDPKLLIEDGNTGDASMQFKISTQSYTMGIDNSDGDKFVLAASSALGTTNVLEVATNGTAAFQEQVLFNKTVNLPGDGTSSREVLINAHGTRGKLMKEGNATYWQVAQGGNQFEITDAANGNDTKGNVMLRVHGNDANDNEIYLAVNGGKVGVGTTDPTGVLHVAGTYGRWKVNGYGGMYFNNNSDTNNTRYIHARSDGALSIGRGLTASLTGDAPDEYFATSFDQLYIKSDGKVGIGTTNPAHMLDVNGNISGSVIYSRLLEINPASTGNGMSISQNVEGFQYDAEESSADAARYWLRFNYTNGSSYPYLTNRTPSGDVAIFTGIANGGGENEHFRIKGGDGTVDAYFTNANVGIGTASPEEKLHVIGNIKQNDFIIGRGAQHIAATMPDYYKIAQVTIDATYGTSHRIEGTVSYGGDNEKSTKIDFWVSFRSHGNLNVGTPFVRYGYRVENLNVASNGFESGSVDTAFRVSKTSDTAGGNKVYEIQFSPNDANYISAQWEVKYSDYGNQGSYPTTVYSTLQSYGTDIADSNILKSQDSTRVDNNTWITQLGVGSSNNTSYSFYNNSTSYFNGSVTVDANLSMTGGGYITTDSNNALTLRSDVQHGQGDEDAVISFKQSTTELAKIDQDGYMYAAGFKVGSGSGVLRADGSTETITFGTMASASTGDYKTSDATETYVGQELASYTTTSSFGTNAFTSYTDHSTQGYLTSYTETSTLADVTGRGATTTNNISVGNLSAVGGTFTDPVTIYDSTTTENPRLSVGRNAGESIQFNVTDVVNTITAKQDSDSDGDHFFVLDRVFAGSGDSIFRIHNDGTPDFTIDGNGVVTLNQYGTAGILQINTSGTISVDTNTYSTATGVADNADAYGSWTVSDGTNTENITSGTTVAWRGSGATSVSYDASTNQFTISSTNTQYSAATTSAAGLMSATDKTKLDGIASGAEVNVQSDWNEATTTSDAYIKNKPTLGTASASAATDFVAVSGDTMTGTLALDNEDSLSFESGKHWITYNDGEGNFNIRVGHKSDGTPNEVSTETGYAFHDEWSQSSGWREFNVSGTSIAAGNDVGTWRRQMYYDYNDVRLSYQGGLKFQTTNTGITVTGEIVTTGGNSTNWSTAYTYSQVGHLPLSGGTVTGMTIFEDGMRIGTGNHNTDGRASITFGESDTTTDSMYIEYDGENLSGDNNAIIFGSQKEGVGDIFRVTYGGSVLVGSNAVATESYVGTAISNLVDSSPAALDTLNELAAALGDDASFSTTMSTALGNRLRIDVNNQSLTSTQKANGRTNLGLGTAATAASTAFLASNGGSLTGDVSSNSVITADVLRLTNDATDTSRHRVAVYDSGATSYGMMLWNASGTSSDWATMIYGPNQDNRRISFGKITSDTFTSHADVTEIAYFDLDDSSLNLDGALNTNTINIGGTVTLTESTDRADLLYINSGTSGWGGLQIGNTSNEFIFSLMGNGNEGGIYDDANSDWMIRWYENAGVQLNYNAEERIITTSQGVRITGATSGTASANRGFAIPKSGLGAIHVTGAEGGTTGSADTVPLITFPGSSSVTTETQGGIYVSQNSSTGTSVAIATTDSYATGPQLSLEVYDNGNVNISRGKLFIGSVATTTGAEALMLVSGEVRSRTLGSNAFNSTAYLEDITPATPSVDSATVVGDTIEVVFSQSSTPDVDYYQVWSAVGSSGSYGMIAHIPQEDVASTMTVIDATFNVSDTMYYRVYAVKSGIYSTAGTINKAFSASALDVANMSVVNLNTAYYIQYEMPDSRFVDHVEIYMDAEAASGDLTRTGATLVYSGNNSSYMYKIGSNDLDKFHQFWVEVIES